MIDTQVILIIVTLLVAIFALWKSFKDKPQDLTPLVVAEQIKSSTNVAKELMEVSQIAVQAAEQLKNTGKLPSNEAAFQYALNYIKRWFPGTTGISNDDIVMAIESAVLVANSLTKKIKE